ncbi:hypothetical protein J4212_05820 [Candidatus Woesearchaeota archaeon]|nr:hypothetical protein [Candidatus Woesearchaeota archaeon]
MDKIGTAYALAAHFADEANIKKSLGLNKGQGFEVKYNRGDAKGTIRAWENPEGGTNVLISPEYVTPTESIARTLGLID